MQSRPVESRPLHVCPVDSFLSQTVSNSAYVPAYRRKFKLNLFSVKVLSQLRESVLLAGSRNVFGLE